MSTKTIHIMSNRALGSISQVEMLQPVKQESTLKCELTYSGKNRTISDSTTAETHSDSLDLKQDPNQSFLDQDLPEVNLKDCLSETPIQIQAEPVNLGIYIQSLMTKLEECYSILPKINTKADFPQAILEKLNTDVNELAACLKDQIKDRVPAPPMAVENVDKFQCSNFDFNSDHINIDEADHSHLKRQPLQIGTEGYDFNDLNHSNMDDFVNQPRTIAQFANGTLFFITNIRLIIEDLHKGLNQEVKKAHDYCVDINNVEIMLSTYVIINRTTYKNNNRNLHEEVKSIKPISAAPFDEEKTTCESSTAKRTCLKKKESKHSEPAYKTVTFMDPKPAAAMAERYKLEHHQIRKQERKLLPKRKGCDGWD